VFSATRRTLTSTKKPASDSKTENLRSGHGLKNEMRSMSLKSKCASSLRRRPPSWPRITNSNVKTNISKSFLPSNNSCSSQCQHHLLQSQSQPAPTKFLMFQCLVAFTSIPISSKTVLMTPLTLWTSPREVFLSEWRLTGSKKTFISTACRIGRTH